MKIDFVQHPKGKGVHVTRANCTIEEFGQILSKEKVMIKFQNSENYGFDFSDFLENY